jgi:polysaccharide deacetylase family sporulation protein PdaB
LLLLILLYVPAEQALAAKSELINKVSTSCKVIALTFDDGNDGEYIRQILQILLENDVKATFFLIGSAAKAYPELLKSILDNGNVIGNHSYSHPYFTDLSSKQMKKEVDKTEAVIKEITGQSTKPFFRPPYGDYNSSVLKAVGNAGYTRTITWTIDTRDWEGISAEKITEEVLSKASPGSIVLMHAGSGAKNTPAALPDIITGLKEMGYRFVTIPELLDYSQTDKKQLGDKEQSDGKERLDDKEALDDKKQSGDKEQPDKKERLDDKKQPDDNLYVVKAGDTLTKLSGKYGVTVQQIVSANHIKNPDLIYVGQVLTIPDVKPAGSGIG